LEFVEAAEEVAAAIASREAPIRSALSDEVREDAVDVREVAEARV
jgi:hypothetical protein